MQHDHQTDKAKAGAGSNRDLEGNDKAPGEEQGKTEKVTNNDLKGKKTDGDPSKDADKPLK